MKILFLTKDTDVLREGTPARASIEAYANLIDVAFVIVLCGRKEPCHKVQKISDKLWFFPTCSWAWWTSPFDARYVARRELWFQNDFQADLIVALDPEESALAGWLMQLSARRPLIVEVMHDIFTSAYRKESRANGWRTKITRFVLPRAHTIRVGSSHIRAVLVAVSPASAKHCVLLPNFFDTEHSVKQSEAIDLHKKYPQFKFIMLMVAPLEAAFNIELGLYVLKGVLHSYRHTGLVIVGEGDEYEHLKKRAEELQLAEHVVFETSNSDLSSYYKTANVFLVTAIDEPYGDTIAQAAENACVIITANVGRSAVLITNGENGFVCESHTPECFVQNILSIMTKPGIRERLRVNSALSLPHEMPKSAEDHAQRLKTLWEHAVYSKPTENVDVAEAMDAQRAS